MAACYVDLDGTLIEYDAPFAEIYAEALERLGCEPRQREVYSEAFFTALGDAPDPFAAAIAETDVDVDPAAFGEAMIAAETENVRAVPGAREVLEALAADHRLGVLTNGVGRAQRSKLEAAGLAGYFEAVVVSGEVGARKPEPEIFRIAEDRLPGESYAFVADDPERDDRPAVDVGWRGVYVGDERPGDVTRVRALEDVPQAL